MILWTVIYSIQFVIPHRLRSVKIWGVWAGLSFAVVLVAFLVNNNSVAPFVSNNNIGLASNYATLAAIAFGGAVLGSISKFGLIGLRKINAPIWFTGALPIALYFILFLPYNDRLPVPTLLILLAAIPMMGALNMRGWKTWGVWALLTLAFAITIVVVPKNDGSAETVALFAGWVAITSSVLGLIIKAFLIKTNPAWAPRAIAITCFLLLFVAFFIPRMAGDAKNWLHTNNQAISPSILVDLR